MNVLLLIADVHDWSALFGPVSTLVYATELMMRGISQCESRPDVRYVRGESSRAYRPLPAIALVSHSPQSDRLSPENSLRRCIQRSSDKPLPKHARREASVWTITAGRGLP
jgi:hypothetical protein